MKEKVSPTAKDAPELHSGVARTGLRKAGVRVSGGRVGRVFGKGLWGALAPEGFGTKIPADSGRFSR